MSTPRLPTTCEKLFKDILKLILSYNISLVEYYFRITFLPNNIVIICIQVDRTNASTTGSPELVELRLPIKDYLAGVNQFKLFMSKHSPVYKAYKVGMPTLTNIGLFQTTSEYLSYTETGYCYYWSCEDCTTEVLKLISWKANDNI